MIKGISIGAVMMTVLSLIIIPLFGYLGNITITNKGENIRLSQTNLAVVHAIDRLNNTLERITDRIVKIEDSEHQIDSRVIKLEEKVKYIGRIR